MRKRDKHPGLRICRRWVSGGQRGEKADSPPLMQTVDPHLQHKVDRNYSAMRRKLPNLRCLRVLRTRKHLKFGSFSQGPEQLRKRHKMVDRKVADQKVVEPIKTITDAASQAARPESEPPHVRRYRAVLFQTALVIIAGAFALLTFLVKTQPSLAIDLQVTKAIQLINFPFFAPVMSAISWAGFGPQDFIITGLIILLIYAFGLHWEAVMALILSLIHISEPTRLGM